MEKSCSFLATRLQPGSGAEVVPGRRRVCEYPRKLSAYESVKRGASLISNVKRGVRKQRGGDP